jgi:photosystem II Psb27 protein
MAMATAMARRVHQSQSQPEGALYCRRDVALLGVAGLISLAEAAPAKASLEEDYSKETKEVINQVKSTIDMEKSNPNTSAAVAALRETSNNWVAKYRREKQLAGKPSFSNMYSVLNAISGHYISFGPTSPIPAKRKARILEEMDVAEKALSKGR